MFSESGGGSISSTCVPTGVPTGAPMPAPTTTPAPTTATLAPTTSAPSPAPTPVRLTSASLRAAVTMWCSATWTFGEPWGRHVVEATYGPMSTWDTSYVTDMSYLFCYEPEGRQGCGTSDMPF